MSTPRNYFKPIWDVNEFDGIYKGFQIIGANPSETISSVAGGYFTNSSTVSNSTVPISMFGSGYATPTPSTRSNAGIVRFKLGGPNVGKNGTDTLLNNYGQILGAAANDLTGFDGVFLDYNDDDNLDVAITAPTSNTGGVTAGAVYLVPSIVNKLQINSTLDLLNCSDCTRISGQPNYLTGWRISKCDFDLNNIDDVCFSAPYFNGTNFSGASFVVKGKSGVWPASINLPITDSAIGYTLRNTPSNSRTGWGLKAVGKNWLFGGAPYGSMADNRPGSGFAIGIQGPQGNASNAIQDLSNLNATTSLTIIGPEPTSIVDPFGIGGELTDLTHNGIPMLGVDSFNSSPYNRTGAGSAFLIPLTNRAGVLDLANITSDPSIKRFNGVEAGQHWSRITPTGNFDGSGNSGYVVTRYTSGVGPTRQNISYIFPAGSKYLQNSTIDLATVDLDGTNAIQVRSNYLGTMSNAIIANPPHDYNGDNIEDISYTLISDLDNRGRVLVFLGSESPRIKFNNLNILDDGTPVVLDATIANITSRYRPETLNVTLRTENGGVSIRSNPFVNKASFNLNDFLNGQVRLTCTDQKKFNYSISVDTPGFAYLPEQSGMVSTTHVPRAPSIGRFSITLKEGQTFLFNSTTLPNITNPDFYQETSKLRLNITHTQNLLVGKLFPDSTNAIASLTEFTNGTLVGKVDNSGLPPRLSYDLVNDFQQTSTNGIQEADINFIFAPKLPGNRTALRMDQGSRVKLTPQIFNIQYHSSAQPNQVRANINSILGGSILNNNVPVTSFTVQDQMGGLIDYLDSSTDFGPRGFNVTLVDETNGGLQKESPFEFPILPHYIPEIIENSLNITQYGTGKIRIDGRQINNPNSDNLFVIFPPEEIINGVVQVNDTTTHTLVPTYNVTLAQARAGRLFFTNEFGTGTPRYQAYLSDGRLNSPLSNAIVNFGRVNFMDVFNGMQLVQSVPLQLSSVNFDASDPATPDKRKIFFNFTSVTNGVLTEGRSFRNGGTVKSLFSLFNLQRNAYFNTGDDPKVKPACTFFVFSETTGFGLGPFECEISHSLQPTTPVITGGNIRIGRGETVGLKPGAVTVVDRNNDPDQIQLNGILSTNCKLLSNQTGVLQETGSFTYDKITSATNETSTIFLRHDDRTVTPCSVSFLATNGINSSPVVPIKVDFIPYYNLPKISGARFTLRGLESTTINTLLIESERPDIVPGNIKVSATTTGECFFAYRSDPTLAISNGTAEWFQFENPSILLVSDVNKPCNVTLRASDAPGVWTSPISVPIDFIPAKDVIINNVNFGDAVVVGLQVTGITALVSTIVVIVRHTLLASYNQRKLKERSLDKSELSKGILTQLKNKASLTRYGCLPGGVIDRYYAGIANLTLRLSERIKTTYLDSKRDETSLLAAIIVEEILRAEYNGNYGCGPWFKNFVCFKRDISQHKLGGNEEFADTICAAVVARVEKSFPELLLNAKNESTKMIDGTLKVLENARKLSCCGQNVTQRDQYRKALQQVVIAFSRALKTADDGVNKALPEFIDIIAPIVVKEATKAVYGKKFGFCTKLANRFRFKPDLTASDIADNAETIAVGVIKEMISKTNHVKKYLDLFTDGFKSQLSSKSAEGVWDQYAIESAMKVVAANSPTAGMAAASESITKRMHELHSSRSSEIKETKEGVEMQTPKSSPGTQIRSADKSLLLSPNSRSASNATLETAISILPPKNLASGNSAALAPGR